MDLPDLHVVELRVGVDVRVRNAYKRAPRPRIWCTRLDGLQDRNERHVVLRATNIEAKQEAEVHIHIRVVGRDCAQWQ